MSRYRFSFHVEASQTQVFDPWTDLDRIHEWVEGVGKVTDGRHA